REPLALAQSPELGGQPPLPDGGTSGIAHRWGLSSPGRTGLGACCRAEAPQCACVGPDEQDSTAGDSIPHLASRVADKCTSRAVCGAAADGDAWEPPPRGTLSV